MTGFNFYDGPVVERIKEEEGLVLLPYQDVHGYTTIGYGTMIGKGISEEEADILLRSRLASMHKELKAGTQGSVYASLPQRRREVILDMMYNLGVPRLVMFKKMWAALAEGDYARAADEIMDSAYARQVPNRARRNAESMREG